MVFFPCAFSLALFFDSRRVLGSSIFLWTQIISNSFLVATGVTTSTLDGGGGEGTPLAGLLEGLLGDLEDCLEGLALVGLHGLLDVREPRVALATADCCCLCYRFHFVLGTRQLFNEPRGSRAIKQIPLASIRKGVAGIYRNCLKVRIRRN